MADKIKGSISLAVLLALMIAMFLFSGQDSDKSSSLSRTVTKAVCNVAVENFDEKPASEQMIIIHRLDKYVRKFAHFSIYAFMGLCLYYSSYKLTAQLRHKAALTAGFCLIFAIFDEIHQIFVPGRAFMVTDILIDLTGSLVGMGFLRIVFLICNYIKRLKKTQISERKRKNG